MERKMPQSVIDTSRDFFHQIVLPVLQREFPDETAQSVFGAFGLGSEVLRLDDEYSRDHLWGIRINVLMPTDGSNDKREAILKTLKENMPSSFQGHEFQELGDAVAGLGIQTPSEFFSMTIGIDRPPVTHEEWLALPDEDIMHVINGELWHDPVGQFTALRQTLNAYYPEPVRLRRMAHWCRYYSGMGVYALKRAILRDNEVFAATAFGKAIRWGIQLAFMLDKHYFPYDKWLLDFFKRLPRMYDRLSTLVEESVRLSTPWERKVTLLDQISDILDATMVEDGLIPTHPPFVGSASSGYRLLENASAELLVKVPEDLVGTLPVWDQVHNEQMMANFFRAAAGNDFLLKALNLTPDE
jgi:hypothetical protein